MVNTHQVDNVLKVLHKGLDGVVAVIPRDSGVGRGFHAQHTALVRTGLQDIIVLQPLAVPKSTGSHMGDQNRLLGCGDDILRGLGTAVGTINEHTNSIHPFHDIPPEVSQPAVVDFLETGTQGIGLAIGDAHLSDAQAIEDLNTIDLVFQDSRTLNDRHPRNLPLCLGAVDVGHSLTADQKILMGNVAKAHPQVITSFHFQPRFEPITFTPSNILSKMQSQLDSASAW